MSNGNAKPFTMYVNRTYQGGGCWIDAPYVKWIPKHTMNEKQLNLRSVSWRQWPKRLTIWTPHPSPQKPGPWPGSPCQVSGLSTDCQPLHWEQSDHPMGRRESGGWCPCWWQQSCCTGVQSSRSNYQCGSSISWQGLASSGCFSMVETTNLSHYMFFLGG